MRAVGRLARTTQCTEPGGLREKRHRCMRLQKPAKFDSPINGRFGGCLGRRLVVAALGAGWCGCLGRRLVWLPLAPVAALGAGTVVRWRVVARDRMRGV